MPYPQLCGLVLGRRWRAASVIAEAALQKGPQDPFYAAKLQTGLFYAEQLLPGTLGLARIVKSGAGSVADADSALL